MKIIITEQQYGLLMKQNINEDFLNWYGENVEKLIDYLGNLMNKMGFEKFLDKYGEFVEKVFGSIPNFFRKLKGEDVDDTINENHNDEYSTSFKRRFRKIDDEIIDLISQAKDEVDEFDYDDYYEYLDNVVYWVVQELQSRYGDDDDFWYDDEDEIIDYIKDKYDEYLDE